MQQVRIKRLPSKALGGTKTGQQTADGALSIQPTAMGGADIDQYIGEKTVDVKKTLQPEPREKSNVEVEKGEVVAGDLNGDGMIETYIAGGKRHSQGGTPLNLPDDTFIFSDTKSMKIKNPDILKKFGKTSGSYTPASLAKQYDINKYRKILQDPDSDAVDRKTAELMIRNYTMKLGALSVAQEGKKGFPQGVPLIAQPFMEANKITEEQVKPTYKPKFASQEPETTEEAAEPQEEVGLDESMPTEMPNGEQIAMSPEMMGEAPMAAYGMNMGGYSFPYAPEYEEGGLVKAQEGTSVKPPYKMNEAYTPIGVVRLNTFRKKYGLPQLKGSVTKADIQKAAGELQAKIAESNPDLLVDYMTTKSHQPNRELLKILPNAKFLPPTEVTQFNRLPNPAGHVPYKSEEFTQYEIPEDKAYQIFSKSKLVSAVVSTKAFLPGHKKRLEFVNSIKDRIDLYGRGIREIPSKLDALRDYMFNIAIENVSCDDNYFSEKIIDCFLTGTVPVYHGCIHIGEFFDERGILSFQTQEELDAIMNSLTSEKYQEMLPYIEANYKKCFENTLIQRWILNHFIQV